MARGLLDTTAKEPALPGTEVMSKPLIIAVTDNNAPDQSAKALDEIGKVLGDVPNVFRTVAHSPTALRSMWSQHVAEAEMRLSPRVRAVPSRVLPTQRPGRACVQSPFCPTPASRGQPT